MSVIETAKKVLDVRQLDLPDKPKVVELCPQPYTDWLGEESLRVWAIFDESTTDEDINGKAIGQIKLAIHDALLEAGIELYPYTRFATRAELEEMGIEV